MDGPIQQSNVTRNFVEGRNSKGPPMGGLCFLVPAPRVELGTY